MLMVLGSGSFGARPRCPLNRVGVVEAYQSLTARTVQGEGIIKPVRLRLARRHLPDHKLHPALTGLIDKVDLSMEVEKGVECRVPICHGPTLSESDKVCQSKASRAQKVTLKLLKRQETECLSVGEAHWSAFNGRPNE
jgi:hypothetical protein